MTKRKLFAFTLLLILSLVLSGCFSQTRAASSEAVAEAEKSIVDTYKAVADAEEAGASIEAYTLLLNSAINLTDQVKIANKDMRYEEAEKLANQAADICNQIIKEAGEAREKAIQESCIKKITFMALALIAALPTTFCTYKARKWWRSRKEKENCGRGSN